MSKITMKNLERVMGKAAVERAKRERAEMAQARKKINDPEALALLRKMGAQMEREADAATAGMPEKTFSQKYVRVKAKMDFIKANERRFMKEWKVSPSMEKRLRAAAEHL